MNRSRIADARERTVSPPPQAGSQFLTRLSGALASPLSVLVVVPCLVLTVGLVLTLLGDRALRGSNLDVARARLGDQAETVARMVRLALAQADPMLDRLAGLALAHTPEAPFEDFAHSLANLMQGRAGVAYVSVSFPDGTFQGAYLDKDGALAFQDSRLGVQGGAAAGQGTLVRRFAFGQPGALTSLGDERTQYDPRKRGFYQKAERAGTRVWTEPYPFYVSRITGITRARPLYRERGGQRELHAVITVDFDVQALSSFLSARSLPGMRAVLYARDGTVLALADSGQPPPPVPREERTLRFSDLGDPVLRTFHASVQSRVGGALGRIVVAGEPYLAVTARASTDPALQWWVAYLAPERAFLGALHRYQGQSLWTSGAVLLVAIAVAWLFALHVTRARREIAAAKAEASRARSAARELGSYRLVSCLGRGGMGEVWRAEHRLLSREAAIKLIKPQLDSDNMDELKARFRREAEALSALRSRHTIELFDYGVADDGTFFFVMELLDGMDLESLVTRHGAQPVARVVPLLIQACASLAEAHDVGLVHRDIKPPNIFICRAADELDVAKVLDFGLVRGVARGEDLGGAVDLVEGTGLSAGQLTSSGGALGTPGYMAPEQALGREIDGRADLYALGCVAVWLLTGRPLFDYENPYQRLIATLTEDVPDLAARIAGGAPEALLSALYACLSKKPEERPSSARALAATLRAIPLPADAAWSEAKAQAFWSEHVPRPKRGSPSSPPPGEPRTLMVAPDTEAS